jgi:hypothetical protein
MQHEWLATGAAGIEQPASVQDARRAWQELDEIRLRSHADLAAQFSQGHHLIAPNSGHLIHLSEPAIILDAIRAHGGFAVNS